MAEVQAGRFTADVDGDFVVFLIGMRVNKLWKLHQWVPVAMAMPRMLRYLDNNPQEGLLSSRMGGSPRAPTVIQYWRSFDDLDRFARNPDAPHLGPWRKYVSAAGSSGDLGIWHETFRVRAVSTRRCTATCRSSASPQRRATSRPTKKVARLLFGSAPVRRMRSPSITRLATATLEL